MFPTQMLYPTIYPTISGNHWYINENIPIGRFGVIETFQIYTNEQEKTVGKCILFAAFSLRFEVLTISNQKVGRFNGGICTKLGYQASVSPGRELGAGID